MIFAEQVKKQLLSLIGEMATVPWLFSKNPSTDFSRTRKLDFASTIQLILSMESGSIKKELLDFFKFSSDTPTASAFAQQRSKLLLATWAFLLHEFNASFPLEKKYNGYHYKFTTGRFHDGGNQKALCNEVGNRDLFQRIKICDWISLFPFKKGGVYHAGNLCTPDSLQLL